MDKWVLIGVPLTNVAVSNDNLGAITLAKTTLAPGEATTGTATYTNTSADAASVPLVNIATATGKAPDGKKVIARAQAQIPTILLQAASLLLVVAARHRIVALTRIARRPISRDAVDWSQRNLGTSRARAFEGTGQANAGRRRSLLARS